MTEKASFTIEFGHDGDTTIFSSDLTGFRYIDILQALATASRAFIDQTATTADTQNLATQEFIKLFLDDVEVSESNVVRKGEDNSDA